MKWPHFDSRMQSSPQGSSTGASLPNSIRFNCIMETQYGTKRQQCALEVSIPDILEAYKIIEPHLLYASNLNNSSTSSQVSQSADLNIDHNQSDLSSLQIPRQNH
ncbi:hypothetical protein Zmor_004440 [Zophobas morio]|uniref:Uncharacterized protein n=2 Tax=Zophobas morio TaxID=2755281 RepID=A0AA38HJR5_9CUCU|nr:hypothetical protein Zmor_004440 [Zophobas morio]